MRLAADPVVNVSSELQSAINRLRDIQDSPNRPSPISIHETHNVPGVDASVRIDVNEQGLPHILNDIEAYGNADQLKLIQEKANGNVVSLAWSVDGDYHGGGHNPKDKIRIAREADRRFSQAISKLPDGTIVENSPVGAASGDYARADIYMHKGFGPLQADLTQYGIIEGGRIKPLSPSLTDDRHSRHLAQRAKAAGDTDLASAITRELERRKSEDIEVKARQGKDVYEYDGGDYYDEDYDYQPDPERINADEFNSRLNRALPVPVDYQGRRNDQAPAGIGVRERGMQVINNVLDPERYARSEDLDDLVLAEGVRRVRQQQLQDIEQGFNPNATANVDNLAAAAPRPVPRQISVQDLVDDRNNFRYRSRDTSMASRNIPIAERRERFISELRDSYGQNQTGWDADNGNLRNQAKRDLTYIYEDPVTHNIVAQQLYDPADIERFREFQVNQALNWPLPTPMGRQAPPILDTQGRAMGPAQSDRHPEAPYQESAYSSPSSRWGGDRTNQQMRGPGNTSFDPYGGQFNDLNGRDVQWRANLPAAQLQQLEDSMTRDLTPQHMWANMVMAKDRINGQIQNGTIRGLTDGSVGVIQQTYGLQPNFDNLMGDVARLDNFNRRGDAVFTPEVAQSLVNINEARTNPQALASIRPDFSSYNIETASPVNRTNPIQPHLDQPFDPDGLIARAREERNNRAAQRRRPRFEPETEINVDFNPREAGQSLSTLRRVDNAVEPTAREFGFDQDAMSEFGYDGSLNSNLPDLQDALAAQRRRREQNQSTQEPWTPQSGRVPEFNDAPEGMTLDQFLEWQDNFRPREMPSDLRGNDALDWMEAEEKRLNQVRQAPMPGSTAIATARPNRMVQRQQRRQASAPPQRPRAPQPAMWNSAPLVPGPDDLPF